MMTKAKGPVWHKKQKEKGVVPNGLTGLDREAQWGKSQADGWVYGHGSFCLTPHEVPLVGLFQWMPNNAHEGKRLGREVVRYEGLVKKVCMDSKADDQALYWNLKQNYGLQLITVPRRGMDKSPERQRMIKDMLTKANQREYKKRSTTVEPMQGLVKDIFELDRCWMRGDASNRWLFAAMGLAMQMAQLTAYRERRSTWDVKADVLGV